MDCDTIRCLEMHKEHCFKCNGNHTTIEGAMVYFCVRLTRAYVRPEQSAHMLASSEMDAANANASWQPCASTIAFPRAR